MKSSTTLLFTTKNSNCYENWMGVQSWFTGTICRLLNINLMQSSRIVNHVALWGHYKILMNGLWCNTIWGYTIKITWKKDNDFIRGNSIEALQRHNNCRRLCLRKFSYNQGSIPHAANKYIIFHLNVWVYNVPWLWCIVLFRR